MDDLTQRIAAIREDTEHGSRWLARQTMLVLRDLASQPVADPVEHIDQIRQAGRELAEARPAMAALAGAVRRILAAPGGASSMARVAAQLLEAYDQAIPAMIAALKPLVQGTVLTHSLSGTVLEVLLACVPPVSHFIVLEGRPLYEGRTTALHLRSQTSASVTLITDAQADIFLPQCQAVIVGADSLLADGSILNKAGTALLARAAQGHAIPFYVLAETLKISPQPWSGELALLEEHPAQEVWSDPAAGINVRNFYFDRTPAALITGILTEQGRLSAVDIARQAVAF
jgi:translation initiation factor 2B subunit (eIF-2B alpha/beta/delta family)